MRIPSDQFQNDKREPEINDKNGASPLTSRVHYYVHDLFESVSQKYQEKHIAAVIQLFYPLPPPKKKKKSVIFPVFELPLLVGAFFSPFSPSLG